MEADRKKLKIWQSIWSNDPLSTTTVGTNDLFYACAKQQL
jgi:hypothetical protein